MLGRASQAVIMLCDWHAGGVEGAKEASAGGGACVDKQHNYSVPSSDTAATSPLQAWTHTPEGPC